MDKMSLFGTNKLNETTKPKQESKISTLSPAPIQDSKRMLTFELDGNTYTLKTTSKEERERVKEEVNANSLVQYDWFREKTGRKNWVLYNTEMYKVECKEFLHYRSDCTLAPLIPINATSCYGMFYECKTFTSIDLSRFNTSNIVDMRYMFADCESLTTLDLSKFITNKVVSMRAMFSVCKNLSTLNLNNFITNRVIDMSEMFSHCESLTLLHIRSFDTSKVKSMHSMFSYCYSIVILDLSSFIVDSVESMKWMFAGCKELTHIYVSDKWDIHKDYSTNFMFSDCINLPNHDELNLFVSLLEVKSVGDNLCLFPRVDASPFKKPEEPYYNLIFILDERTYKLDVDSSKNRERVKKEVNSNSLAKYDWFEETAGKKHWVLYNMDMYYFDVTALQYKDGCGLARPFQSMPLIATSDKWVVGDESTLYDVHTFSKCAANIENEYSESLMGYDNHYGG